MSGFSICIKKKQLLCILMFPIEIVNKILGYRYGMSYYEKQLSLNNKV